MDKTPCLICTIDYETILDRNTQKINPSSRYCYIMHPSYDDLELETSFILILYALQNCIMDNPCFFVYLDQR